MPKRGPQAKARAVRGKRRRHQIRRRHTCRGQTTPSPRHGSGCLLPESAIDPTRDRPASLGRSCLPWGWCAPVGERSGASTASRSWHHLRPSHAQQRAARLAGCPRPASAPSSEVSRPLSGPIQATGPTRSAATGPWPEWTRASGSADGPLRRARAARPVPRSIGLSSPPPEAAADRCHSAALRCRVPIPPARHGLPRSDTAAHLPTASAGPGCWHHHKPLTGPQADGVRGRHPAAAWTRKAKSIRYPCRAAAARRPQDGAGARKPRAHGPTNPEFPRKPQADGKQHRCIPPATSGISPPEGHRPSPLPENLPTDPVDYSQHPVLIEVFMTTMPSMTWISNTFVDSPPSSWNYADILRLDQDVPER